MNRKLNNDMKTEIAQRFIGIRGSLFASYLEQGVFGVILGQYSGSIGVISGLYWG